MEFKDKKKRTECYTNRDFYFQCLDSNQDNSEACKKELEKFTQLCGAKWTDHFIKKRKYEQFKKKYMESGDSIDDIEIFKQQTASSTRPAPPPPQSSAK